MMSTKYGNKAANQTIFPFVLPALPFAKDSLAPHMTANTFDYHHGKHHNTYVTNLNNLVKDSSWTQLSLEDVIIKSHNEKQVAIFNNSAQVWNHTFFWNCMKPAGGGAPTGKLADKINSDFGSFDQFKEEFKAAGTSQFGSGWAWLVLYEGKLKVVKTANADLPLVHNQHAILTCDVWEHAYYLDYQNRRPDYIAVFLDHLVNWDFAEQNLLGAL
jgi:Fe-Mn family superoxide dismutase